MPLAPLTSDEVEILREVRDTGQLVLAPEARSFAHAEDLTRKGLLRAVTLRGVPHWTFLLSGEGIAIIGRSSPAGEQSN